MPELTQAEQKALDAVVSQGESSFIFRYIGQQTETQEGRPRGNTYKFDSYDLEARTVTVTHLESGESETVYLGNVRIVDRATNGNH